MEWLFDTTHFMTRTHCGKWSDWLIAINQMANFLIFLAYVTIPIALFSLWRTVQGNEGLRRLMKYDAWIVLMFVIFILSCGFTHLMDVLAFNWAPYRFFTLLDCITAASSIPTAILLPSVLKKIFEEGTYGE